MKFEVDVVKQMTAKGKVTVDCDDYVQAVEMVSNQIASNTLKTTDVNWDEPEYNDFTLDIAP
jgi:hypothetical protein